MFNLLPEKEKKAVQSEYSKRRLVLILASACLTLLTSGVFLIPSYWVTKTLTKNAETTAETLKQNIAVRDQESLDAFVSMTNKKIGALSDLSQESLTAHLERMTENRSQGMRLTTFTMGMAEVAKKEAKRAVVGVEGIAANRETLMGFASRLRSDPAYSEIDLPISNFADEVNIEFTLSAIGK